MPSDIDYTLPNDFTSGYPTGSGGNFGGNYGDPFSAGKPSQTGSGGSGFFSDPNNIYGLINAAIGLFAGSRAAGATNQALGLQGERLDAARRAASTDNFTAIVARLQPVFRELVASGIGPQFQSALAGNLAKSGIGAGTGVGAALKNAGLAIPSIAALNAAMGEAGNVQQGQVGVEMGFPQMGVKADPFAEALVRGATAYFATTTPKNSQGQQGTAPRIPELFPGIEPNTRGGYR